MMDHELSLPVGEFLFLVCFMHSHSVTLQIATLVLSAMVAGEANQTIPVQITHVFCCIVVHKLSMCNFDSCKCLT